MVHVPFFNVDLPEPRLGALIPDTIGAVVQITSKALEYGQDILYPPSPEDLKAFEQKFEAQIPREFDRVRKRYAEGKIVNDEQLSSELEDASFDWYRRQLRTSVIGATDEEMEDVAARKLGLAGPSLQAAVQQRFLDQAVAASGGLDLQAELHDAQLMAKIQEREAEQERQLSARAARVAELRRQLRPGHKQAIGALTNASGGLLLGVLLVKSVVMAGQRLFRKRPPRPPAQSRRQAQAALAQEQQQQRAQAAASATTAAPAARQQGGAQRQAQQAQPQAQQQPQASSAATGASAARRRPVKRR